MMSASTPLTPFVLSRQKPQAKSLSPASRSLFGQSSATEVAQMLNEMLMSEKQKAQSKLNFDVSKDAPIGQQQQENIVEVDRTPESSRRYAWKLMKPGEAPQFYYRRYKGKKSLMPVDILSRSPEPASSRSRSVRRSLNGYLRSASKEEKQAAIRSLSPSESQGSPLRTTSPQRIADFPASFEDSLVLKGNTPLLRPLAVHASSENSLTTKVYSPMKPVSNRIAARSPLSQRENQSRSVTALVFSATPKKTSIATTTARRVTESNVSSCTTQGLRADFSSEKQTTSSFTTPKTSTSSTKRQLLLPEIMQARKFRSSGQKAKKRLVLSQEDSPSMVPSAKTPKLTQEDK